ncbi:DUF84 family protein [Pseudalkalibacillus caeni]|uniref:Probable inosine/xanthosine triphosphatase n=1 Tax=Exobacillus caeni TaxID=2574798 RepID=A0A5R9F713_9BACL|nr:DUF84 family protein [Pseudalkalibacillus caeni]TLS39407.1 DUF84 family protein [Pseudalkalibacillus caeni]
MYVGIGSKNPVKVKAVEEVIDDGKAVSLNVPSGVSEQPFSDEETRLGAINRAKAVVERGKVEIGIGLEGGVEEIDGQFFVCNWGAIADKNGTVHQAGGARFPLPDVIGEKLRKGEELGPIMSEYARIKEVNKKEGAIGIFTDGALDRKEMYVHIVKILIGQFKYYSKVKA